MPWDAFREASVPILIDQSPAGDTNREKRALKQKTRGAVYYAVVAVGALVSFVAVVKFIGDGLVVLLASV
jgi:hypothetical protein